MQLLWPALDRLSRCQCPDPVRSRRRVWKDGKILKCASAKLVHHVISECSQAPADLLHSYYSDLRTTNNLSVYIRHVRPSQPGSFCCAPGQIRNQTGFLDRRTDRISLDAINGWWSDTPDSASALSQAGPPSSPAIPAQPTQVPQDAVSLAQGLLHTTGRDTMAQDNLRKAEESLKLRTKTAQLEAQLRHKPAECATARQTPRTACLARASLRGCMRSRSTSTSVACMAALYSSSAHGQAGCDQPTQAVHVGVGRRGISESPACLTTDPLRPCRRNWMATGRRPALEREAAARSTHIWPRQLALPTTPPGAAGRRPTQG